MEKETTFYGFLGVLIKDVLGSIKRFSSSDIDEADIDEKLNLNVFSSVDQEIIKDALSEVSRDEVDLENSIDKPSKGKKDFTVPKEKLVNSKETVVNTNNIDDLTK